MGFAEEMGFGLTSLKENAERLGLPLPSYSMESEMLVLTIYRSRAAATSTLERHVLEHLSKSEQAGWEWLATKQTVTSRGYAKAMRIANRTALNHFQRFADLGLLKKIGSGPGTHYLVVQK